ncbi:V-type ATP synthase subunit E family protein [Pseudomonas sp. HK3]|jgi:type III secretion system HrpE/YscL family protein
MLSLTRITLTQADITAYDKVIPANLVIASRTANNIIEDAIKAANKITHDAQKNYQLKSDQGYNEGQKQWEIQKAVDITKLNIEIKQHIMTLHEKLTNNVLQITQKLVGSLNETDLLRGLVNQAIDQLSTECVLNLRVSPENSETAKQVTQNILADHPTLEGFNIIVDPRLSESDCLLEHPDGTHDISARTQLNSLTDILK